MPLSDLELEKLELKYLGELDDTLNKNLEDILRDLRSRIKLYDDWYNIFRKTARKGYRASDLQVGAERIIAHHLMVEWNPISAPIGSDFMYENEDAIIHLEIKTALVTNPADYKGKFDLGENQSSYPGKLNKKFLPKLPIYYNKNTREEKPCLTYVLLIINVDAKTILSKNLDQDPVAIILFCVPNGQLFSIYGNKVMNAGKRSIRRDGTKGDFRYKYEDNSIFREIQNKEGKTEKRYKVKYFNEKYKGKKLNDIEITFDNLFNISKNGKDIREFL